MSDPHSSIPHHAWPSWYTRIEEWRAQRYERRTAKYAHRFVALRNRRSYRLLIVLSVASEAVLIASAIAAFFTQFWFFPTYALSIIALVSMHSLLRVVTGNVADAPVFTLDEIQLAQRNAARSVGYFALFGAMFIPFFVLITLGTINHLVSGQNVYGAGLLVITLVASAGVLPTQLLAWWTNDPDPEDAALPPS